MNYLPNKKEFVFGSFVYHYDLLMQDRKTLSLTVAPDLKIYVKCPHNVGSERIELFLRKKWFWLEKQLGFFKKYQRKYYKKEYISGESIQYLGKQYKLLVKQSPTDKVLMMKGLLIVFSTKSGLNGKYTKKLLDKWYEKRMYNIFFDRYEQVKHRFNYKEFPKLVVREMQKRWGSYLSSNILMLNPKLIHVSTDCIDYVISHELCHVRHREHNTGFYKLMGQKWPKWEKVKHKLEIMGSTI